MELSFSLSDKRRIPCTTDLSGRAAVAMIHIAKPYR
jgi:hypothetical protein